MNMEVQATTNMGHSFGYNYVVLCCFPKDTVLGGMWWIDMDWGFYFKQQEGYI